MSRWRTKVNQLRQGGLRQLLRELAWIGSYGYRYRRAVVWYIFLGITATAMSLGASVLSKNIVDAVTGYTMTALAPAAALYLGLQLARIGVNAWTSRISAKIEVRVDQEIRAEVYDRIMAADWQAMSKYHSGDLLNRVDNDVASVSASVLGWIPDVITRTVQFAGALGIILYHDATLAGLALASAPLTILVSRGLMPKMRSYNRQMREASSRVMMFNEESFQNIQAIKSFGLGQQYGNRLRQVQGEYRRVKLDYNKFSVAASALMSLTGTLVSVSCFGWGVYRLWGGHITYGTMILFLQMAGTLSAAFSALVKLVPNAISAATAAGRIMAVTELPEEDHSQDRQAQALLDQNRGAGVRLAVEAVTFAYQAGPDIFRQAGLQAEPGEIVALIGPSGEGKTTMLRLLLGIIQPQAGSITVTGMATGETMAASASTRRLFAYVPQSSAMFAGTVGENLRLLNPEATEEQLWHALELTCAGDFVRRMPQGLDSPLGEGGGGLSQGQAQRLSIARAILADAPILLLDEATSALDTRTEGQLLQNVVGAFRGKTVLVTTHRPGVLDIAHRVYALRGGQAIRQTPGQAKQSMHA